MGARNRNFLQKPGLLSFLEEELPLLVSSDMEREAPCSLPLRWGRAGVGVVILMAR
jgi:hypothetical protein